MPNRVLRDWTTSEVVDSLTPQAEVFFTRLIMKADDYGSFYANPKLIRSALFPLKDYKDKQIQEWVDECLEAKLLITYTVDDKTYIRIENFGQRLRNMRYTFPRLDSDPLPSRRDSPPETKLKRNETESETRGSLTFEMFKRVVEEDEIFFEALAVTHKGKDIQKAIAESFAYLIADKVRAQNASNADIRKLVNTWLSNGRAEKQIKNETKRTSANTIVEPPSGGFGKL